MPEVTESYPFAGASTCYGRAYKLLHHMGRNGYVTRASGKRSQGYVAPEMSDLIAALDTGDEETIKGFLIDHRFFDIVHETQS